MLGCFGFEFEVGLVGFFVFLSWVGFYNFALGVFWVVGCGCIWVGGFGVGVWFVSLGWSVCYCVLCVLLFGGFALTNLSFRYYIVLWLVGWVVV